jgi:two-component system phosphate regulon response regulator PhoB
MSRQKIIAIEDESDILEVIEYNLKKEGYEVAGVEDGEDGLELVRSKVPDLVLLDLMLPGMDGLEVCRRIRYDPRTRHIPIVMLTAKGEESDIVTGLEVGADDYIAKPFAPREMVARVRAVLRRSRQRSDEADEAKRIILDELVIDPTRHEVVVRGKKLEFTATEFRLLHFLASHPGRVFSRQRLVKEVVGEDAYILERNIDVHIRAIRKKLEEFSEWIMTVRGVGYRFRDPDEG